MRTITALIALALLTPALPGCPPVRADDDDIVGDDDDSTEAEAMEEGYWRSETLTVLSDDCGVGESAQQLGFELMTTNEWGDFALDWGVGQTLDCSLSSDAFVCGALDFMVQQDAGTAIEGTLDFDGDVLSPDRLSGVVLWEVTCSGTNCAQSELPADTTCLITLEGAFEHSEDDEPTVPVGGDEEDDEGDEGTDAP